MSALNSRLNAVASLIKPGSRVADIGTDHALLPIYLRENEICPHVIACDIGILPLKSAARNVEACGVCGIETRLCDGLCGVREDEADTIVIAGMGGECIAGILKRCTYPHDGSKTFIVQPMNSPEYLREFLYRNGYIIKSETAVVDAGRVYTVILAVNRPDTRARDERFFYCGLLKPKKETDCIFLKKQYRRIKKCADDLSGVAGMEAEREHCGRIAALIYDYLRSETSAD